MVINTKKLFLDAKVPQRASPGAVGYDVYAYHLQDKFTREHAGDLPAMILPGEACLIGIGVAFAVPFPVDCQARPRSGLASKHNIELSNSPGTIDPDFRGEAGILLRNRGAESFSVEKEMRIAQLVFTKAEIPELVLVETLPATLRGRGGFGSTGLGTISLGDGEYRHEQEKWDRHFLEIATSTANLSECLRGAKQTNGLYKCDARGRYLGATRRFGCVIVKDQVVVAQGFNVRAAGCSEVEGCIRERMSIPTGTSLELGCVHAEQVALQNHARSGGTSLIGATVYVNAEPCLSCAKLLAGCGISTVVVPSSVYPTNGLIVLRNCGVEVRQVEF